MFETAHVCLFHIHLILAEGPCEPRGMAVSLVELYRL